MWPTAAREEAVEEEEVEDQDLVLEGSEEVMEEVLVRASSTTS